MTYYIVSFLKSILSTLLLLLQCSALHNNNTLFAPAMPLFHGVVPRTVPKNKTHQQGPSTKSIISSFSTTTTTIPNYGIKHIALKKY